MTDVVQAVLDVTYGGPRQLREGTVEHAKAMELVIHRYDEGAVFRPKTNVAITWGSDGEPFFLCRLPEREIVHRLLHCHEYCIRLNGQGEIFWKVMSTPRLNQGSAESMECRYKNHSLYSSTSFCRDGDVGTNASLACDRI